MTTSYYVEAAPLFKQHAVVRDIPSLDEAMATAKVVMSDPKMQRGGTVIVATLSTVVFRATARFLDGSYQWVVEQFMGRRF